MKRLSAGLRGAWARKSLWLVQGVGNLLALALLWVWLSLPDSSGAQLALSFALGLALICGWVWMQGATLAAYRVAAGVPWRATFRRLPRLLFCVLLWCLALWAIARWCPRPARGAAQVLVFLLLIPLASQVAARGWRLDGLGGCFFNWRYYAGFLGLAALGVWLPVRLITWVPNLRGLGLETASITVRFLLAYLLMVGCWLALAALIGSLSEDRAARAQSAAAADA